MKASAFFVFVVFLILSLPALADCPKSTIVIHDGKLKSGNIPTGYTLSRIDFLSMDSGSATSPTTCSYKNDLDGDAAVVLKPSSVNLNADCPKLTSGFSISLSNGPNSVVKSTGDLTFDSGTMVLNQSSSSKNSDGCFYKAQSAFVLLKGQAVSAAKIK